jgi:hypothetical protein
MAFDPTSALQQVLGAHGFKTDSVDQGLLVGESGLILSAEVVRVQNHPQTTMVQLDVRAVSPRLGDKLLIESFAGGGTDESGAAEQAFRKFLRGSLHVLLAVLVDSKFGVDQVEWETWSSGDLTWRVCLGPVTLQGAPPENLVFGELLNELSDELLPRLSQGTHWVRFFFWKDGPEIKVSELLVDNIEWPAGKEIIGKMRWPDGAYSAREFLMMHG